MGKWLGCALLAYSLSGVLAPSAHAADAPRTSSLGWVRLPGAESCIGTRDLARGVEQRLGRNVFVPPSHAEVSVEGHIEPLSGRKGFHAHVVLSNEKGVELGTRDLDVTSANCRELDEQLALVVGLLIDPDAAMRPPPPPKPVELPKPVEPPKPLVVERVVVHEREGKPPPREPWRQRVTVAAGVSAGLLPGFPVGLVLRGEITPPSFVPIELGGSVWLESKAEDGPKGAGLVMAYGRLGLCPAARDTARFFLRGCAVVEVGAVRATGYGFRVSTGRELPVV